MRLNVDTPHELNNYARVFLDGVEQEFCLIADEGLGEVVLRAIGETGSFIVDDQGHFVTVVKKGKVEIFDSRSPHLCKYK